MRGQSTEGRLELGLFAVNMLPSTGPAELMSTARLAEDEGFESVWAGEHPVLPDPAGPFDPRLPLVDPLIIMSYVAAVTSRIRLATGILILPLRHPVILAKQVASLDMLSNGRLILGIGMGYIKAETEALGIDFDDRGRRGDEYLAAMRQLWHARQPSFDGRFVRLNGVDAHPRPVQSDVDVVVGGNGARSLRRAVISGHGWYGWNIPPAGVPDYLEKLHVLSQRHSRPESLGPLEITITPQRGAVTLADLQQYRDAGVHRVVLFPPEGVSLPELEDYIRGHAALVREVNAAPVR